MKLQYLLATIILLSATASGNPPVGDVQGTVSAVRVQNLSEDGHSFRVYFSNVTNDRFGCVANDGFIAVRGHGHYVSRTSFRMMYEMALEALASGKKLALEGAGGQGINPCLNINTAMVLAN